MIVLVKKNFRIWKKIVVIFFGCFIFCVGARNKIGLTFGLTYEQHILSAVTDHYYLTYFLLPMILLCCFTFIEDDEEIVISRFQSYYSYFIQKWFGTSLWAVGIVFFQSVAIFLSGVGLSRNNVWILPVGAVEAELFAVLSHYFSTPNQGFWAATFFQFVGIWAIMGFLMWICHFVGRKGAVRFLVLFYSFSVLWIKIPVLQDLPITGLNHLFILHHNLTTPERFSITAATVILLVFIMLLTIKFLWRSSISNMLVGYRGLKVYYFRESFTKKNLVILFSVVIGITLYKGLQHPSIETSEEWIYFLFSGHGTGYVQILPFLEMLIINGTPLYLLAIFVEKAIHEQSLFVPIRLKNRREWMYAILMIGAGFLFFYSFLWGMAGLLGGLGFGYRLSNKALQLLLAVIVIKWLDILVQYFFMILLYSCTKQITIGFLILVGGNMLCILPEKIVTCLPFGLSSMARISGLNLYQGISFTSAVSILVISILALTSWLLLIGHRKL